GEEVTGGVGNGGRHAMEGALSGGSCPVRSRWVHDDRPARPAVGQWPNGARGRRRRPDARAFARPYPAGRCVAGRLLQVQLSKYPPAMPRLRSGETSRSTILTMTELEA